jgi:hypothetical protein
MVKARISLGWVGSDIFERLCSSKGREQPVELFQTKNGISSIWKAMAGDNDGSERGCRVNEQGRGEEEPKN